MKLEKKHWIIIGVVVAIIAVWYFFLRKKKAEKTETGYGPMGGSYSHFGDETNFGVPGSGYGLNAMESGYKAGRTGRTGTVGTTMCTPPQVWSDMAGACIDPSARVAKVPFGVAGASGRVSGIAGAGTGTGGAAGMTTADCMTACRNAGFGVAPCKARCSGGASTSM